MTYLVDTSILLRLANTSDEQEPIARHAVLLLHQQGELLHVTPQNMIEYRNAATRPVSNNGLGFPSEQVEQQIADFEALFPLLVETAEIYPAWKALVSTAGIIGKQVHDARLVAICQVYSVRQVLTFNTRHFIRLAAFVPDLTIIHPADVTSQFGTADSG